MEAAAGERMQHRDTHRLVLNAAPGPTSSHSVFLFPSGWVVLRRGSRGNCNRSAGKSEQVSSGECFFKSNQVRWVLNMYKWLSVFLSVCVWSLSSSVLQGFTCTRVRTIKRSQIKKLIKACRRRGRNRVRLAETQVRRHELKTLSVFPAQHLLTWVEHTEMITVLCSCHRQLTCMYNYIRTEADATSFNLYPPDMLLYYEWVLSRSCRTGVRNHQSSFS